METKDENPEMLLKCIKTKTRRGKDALMNLGELSMESWESLSIEKREPRTWGVVVVVSTPHPAAAASSTDAAAAAVDEAAAAAAAVEPSDSDASGEAGGGGGSNVTKWKEIKEMEKRKKNKGR